MKEFNFLDLPVELQAIVIELPNVELDEKRGAEFKVNTAPDPEWGNMHIPLALWLIKNGANKGEKVYLKGIVPDSDFGVSKMFDVIR